MDLWSLKVLDAVLTAGSVSGAAVLVRRTQPQVSRIIRSLEDELGIPLFSRQGRRLIPTPNCDLVLARGRRILDELDALRVAAREMRTKQDALLHIVGPPYAFHGLLPLVVARMRQALPEAHITMSSLTRQENGEWMIPERFDIGVAILPFGLPLTDQEPLGAVDVVLIVPKDHPLSGLTSAGPQDLVGQDYIALRPATPLRRRIDRIMEMADVALDIVVTVPDTTSALRLVMEGVGITLGDALSAKHIGRDRVVSIPFSPPLRAKFGIFWPSDQPKTLHCESFIQLTKAVLAEEHPSFIQGATAAPGSA